MAIGRPRSVELETEEKVHGSFLVGAWGRGGEALGREVSGSPTEHVVDLDRAPHGDRGRRRDAGVPEEGADLGFEPSAEAMAPSAEMVALERRAFADAVAAGQLGAGADPDEVIWLSGALISGVIGMALANEPDVPWGKGRFSPLLPRLLETLPALYPPKPSRRRS
jgi:hypothetical protein